jgi:hypothetical protein
MYGAPARCVHSQAALAGEEPAESITAVNATQRGEIPRGKTCMSN